VCVSGLVLSIAGISCLIAMGFDLKIEMG